MHQIGPTDGKPVVPLNVIGDFGGGGLLMAFGIVCALLERGSSGRGQTVDAAMIDGAASFMAMFFGYRAIGQFSDRTGAHLLGGGAHYYDVYEAADGKHLAVAPIEPQFYREFVARLGLDAARFLPAGYPNVDEAVQSTHWPVLKRELQRLFKTRTCDEWIAVFDGVDACVTPVLSLADALDHPHHRARGSFVTIDGVAQPMPAPRFDRSQPAMPTGAAKDPTEWESVLREWAE